MLRFIKALLPHFILVSIGVVGGGVTGLFIDFQVLRDGGLGPAAAHAGPVVLFLLAAVPVLGAVAAGYVGLLLSLVATLLWDVVQRRWRRRTLVRAAVLLGCAQPWAELNWAVPPEGGWTILHYVATLLLSLIMATVGLISGLMLAKFLMSPEPKANHPR